MRALQRQAVLVAFVAFLSLGAELAFAQVLTGAINGRVTDASGAVLPGVTVTVTSPALIGGPQVAVTDSLGNYHFTLLQPGTYRVNFQLSGFTTLNVDGVSVVGGSTMTVNQHLTVAALSESVTVTSQAPAVDLKSTNIATNWSAQKFNNLPYGRGIRGFVRLLPGVSMKQDQFDVGGNTVGGAATSGGKTYGRSGDELYEFDGVIWDQFFGDYNTYSQVQASSASKGAQFQSPGLTLNYLIKSGGNQFHGNYLAAYQGPSLESNNVSQSLLDRGFVPGDNKFTRYTDFFGDLGGPILHDRLWFYGSYGQNYSGLLIPGFISEKTGQQVVFFTRLDNPTAKLTYQASKNNRFEVTAQANRKWEPYRTGSAFTPAEAAQDQLAWTLIGPAIKWDRVLSSHMTLDAGFNRSGYWWPDLAWTSDPRQTDLTTGQNRGAFLTQNRKPIRWGWNGTWSWFANIHGMSHNIQSGFQGYRSTYWNTFSGYPYQEVFEYRSLPGDTNYFLHPDAVQVYNYPNYTNTGVGYEAWFANDAIDLSSRLTLNAGLRFDHYSSWLGAQGNPGTGPFATMAVSSPDHNFPTYNEISPRLSVIYDLTGAGRTVLKASYGRYGASGSGPNAASGPVAAQVNPATTIVKTYTNWDGSIPYTPVPGNLASVTGGGKNAGIASNIKPFHEDEYTAGVDLGLNRILTARFDVVRKQDYNENEAINAALPFGAYTDMVTGVDPGPDNVVGTADDSVVDVWSVPRTDPNFGTVDTVYINGGRKDRYTAFEATLNKQYDAGWSMLASYSVDRHTWVNDTPVDPNQAKYNWSLPETYQEVHLNGMYDRLPWGLQLSATYSAQSGAYYPRIVQVRNALHQITNVTVQGHAGRYNWVRLLDARASKVIHIGNQRLELMLDAFNVLNTSVVLQQVNTNGPNYLKPLSGGGIDAATATSIPAPRILRISVRFTF